MLHGRKQAISQPSASRTAAPAAACRSRRHPAAATAMQAFWDGRLVCIEQPELLEHVFMLTHDKHT